MSHVPLFIHDGKRLQSELRLDVKKQRGGEDIEESVGATGRT